MITLSLGGTIDITELRLAIWRRGVWQVDADLDLGSDVALPSGDAQVQITNAATGKTAVLQGTIATEGTGRFGEKATARIIAGKGGWSTPAPKQHFKNDANVTVADVLNATAAAVGETITDVPTDPIAPDYVRTEGPAERVLVGLDWYVDGNGTTHVGERGSVDAPDDVEVLFWDPLRRTLDLAADSIVWPGMTITDARCGTVTIRDVEQTFTRTGARATATCARSSTGEVAAMFRTMIEEFAGIAFLKSYRYRIVQQQTGPAGSKRLNLQAVKPTSGVPDLLPVDVWPGMAGFDADYPLGTLCIVSFTEGDPSLPRISEFQAPAVASTDFIARASTTNSLFNSIVMFAAACGNALNPQVSEIKAAAVALYDALTGSTAPPPAIGPYQSATDTASKIGKVA